MPKQSLKEKLKGSFSKLQHPLNANKTPSKKNPENKTSAENKPSTNKRFKFQFPKINLGSKKKTQEIDVPSVAKSLPKGIKIADKYPLYEPFSQVVIVQDPKTGEYKYVLDELQLDPLERGIYNRILDMLLAEIESPKDQIKDQENSSLKKPKK